MRFIGRDAELHVLQRAFRSPRSELIPIYGRRRVGKSELILKFMAHKPGLYYLGQQSSTALQQLTGLGYLRRRYPLERQPPNPRHVRFGIDDPLLRFWFRFVFPNVSVIRASGPARAFADRISSSLDAWFGSCFERLCREALPLIYAQQGVAAGPATLRPGFSGPADAMTRRRHPGCRECDHRHARRRPRHTPSCR